MGGPIVIIRLTQFQLPLQLPTWTELGNYEQAWAELGHSPEGTKNILCIRWIFKYNTLYGLPFWQSLAMITVFSNSIFLKTTTNLMHLNQLINFLFFSSSVGVWGHHWVSLGISGNQCRCPSVRYRWLLKQQENMISNQQFSVVTCKQLSNFSSNWRINKMTLFLLGNNHNPH